MKLSVLRTAIVTVLILVAATPLFSEYAIGVDTAIGIGGRFRADRWTPVRVTLENLGQDVSGEVEVSVVRGDRFGNSRTTVAYRRPLDLMSGATKAFNFVLPLATAAYPINVRVYDGDTMAHQETYELLGRALEDTFVVVLARRPNLDFLLPLYNTTTDQGLDIVYPLPDYLPEQWQGYDSVDLIVIHDARVQDLSSRQLEALRSWVAAGGRIVISGGAHFGAADSETLSLLGDLRTTGITTTTLADAGFASNAIPYDADETSAELVSTVFRTHGTEITYLPIGRGDVVLLPFDYAQLVRVAPMSSIGLWNTLIRNRPESSHLPTLARRRVFETEILSNQLGLPLYDFPSRFLVIGLMLSFGIAIGAVFIWMSRRREPRTLLFGLPVVLVAVVLTSLVAQVSLTNFQQPTEALALTVETIDLQAGSDRGLLTQDTILFSRQGATYEVQYAGNPLVIPLDNRDQIVMSDPDGTTLEINVERWRNQNGYAAQLVELPVIATTQYGGGYVNVSVENSASESVRNMVMLSNDAPLLLGTVAPNEIVEGSVHAYRPPSELAEVDWNELVPEGPYQGHTAQLLSDLARIQRRESAEGGAPAMLVGWLAQPLLGATIVPSFDRDIRMSVVVIRISGEKE